MTAPTLRDDLQTVIRGSRVLGLSEAQGLLLAVTRGAIDEAKSSDAMDTLDLIRERVYRAIGERIEQVKRGEP